MAALTNLILVCCHAIYLGGPSCGVSEEEWLLAPFQPGEVTTFTSHVKTGLSLLSSSGNSILVFSGSKTRSETQKSEARSYLDLCLDNDFWGVFGSGDEDDGGREGILKRIVLEEQALDSFANFVLGVLRFWKETGIWPSKITIISHAFKRARFLDLHVKAARWSMAKVGFVGIDPTYMVMGSDEWDEKRTERVLRGERERGYRAWEQDMLGCGSVLRGKRRERNFWCVGQAWFGSEEERVRSGIRLRVVNDGFGGVEEALLDEKQPWETE